MSHNNSDYGGGGLSLLRSHSFHLCKKTPIKTKKGTERIVQETKYAYIQKQMKLSASHLRGCQIHHSLTDIPLLTNC